MDMRVTATVHLDLHHTTLTRVMTILRVWFVTDVLEIYEGASGTVESTVWTYVGDPSHTFEIWRT